MEYSKDPIYPFFKGAMLMVLFLVLLGVFGKFCVPQILKYSNDYALRPQIAAQKRAGKN